MPSSAPRSCEALLVPEPLEHRDQPLGLRTDALHVQSRIGLKVKVRLLEKCSRLDPLVARRPRPVDGVLQDRVRPGERSRLDQRRGELRLRAQPQGVMRGQQRARALEQVHGRWHVPASGGGPLSRRQQALGRMARELAPLVVQRPELEAVPMCLLEVVTEDLVQLDEIGTVLFEPGGEALVQLGAGRLRQCVVGRVADQEVAEAVRVLACEAAACRDGRAPCARGP